MASRLSIMAVSECISVLLSSQMDVKFRSVPFCSLPGHISSVKIPYCLPLLSSPAVPHEMQQIGSAAVFKPQERVSCSGLSQNDPEGTHCNINTCL